MSQTSVCLRHCLEMVHIIDITSHTSLLVCRLNKAYSIIHSWTIVIESAHLVTQDCCVCCIMLNPSAQTTTIQTECLFSTVCNSCSMSAGSLPRCGFVTFSVSDILQSIVKTGWWLWEMLINLLKFPILQSKGSVSDQESISATTSPPNVNQFFCLVGPIITPRISEISLLLLQQSCSDRHNWLTERTNDRKTDLIAHLAQVKHPNINRGTYVPMCARDGVAHNVAPCSPRLEPRLL